MASYTLVLSRGMYVLDEPSGKAVLKAMTDGEQTVVVDVDLLGDGFKKRDVRLVIAHIVAIIPNDNDVDSTDELPFGPNVTALHPLRQAR